MAARTTSRVWRSPSIAAFVLAVALLAVVPACSSSSTPTAATTSSTTSTTSDVTPPQGSSAEVASCEADAKSLEVALEADAAQNGGTFPSPPSLWSASAYAGNFAPLLTATGGGPYLHNPPATKFYVIEYDSSGHVWVAHRKPTAQRTTRPRASIPTRTSAWRLFGEPRGAAGLLLALVAQAAAAARRNVQRRAGERWHVHERVGTTEHSVPALSVERCDDDRLLAEQHTADR